MVFPTQQVPAYMRNVYLDFLSRPAHGTRHEMDVTLNVTQERQ